MSLVAAHGSGWHLFSSLQRLTRGDRRQVFEVFIFASRHGSPGRQPSPFKSLAYQRRGGFELDRRGWEGSRALTHLSQRANSAACGEVARCSLCRRHQQEPTAAFYLSSFVSRPLRSADSRRLRCAECVGCVERTSLTSASAAERRSPARCLSSSSKAQLSIARSDHAHKL